MVDKAFSAVIRRLRQERNISQEKLALEAELHRTYISQLERGLKSPSLKTVYKISKVLGTPLPELMVLILKEMKNLNPDSPSPK
jgi:transcriptional regulator with XRE-family HTH domain